MNKITWLLLASLTAFGFYLIGKNLTTANLPSQEIPIELYATETHQDLQITFSQAINEAKKSIHLIIYGLHDRKILKSLRNAADRGVNVQVVCDHHASSGVAKKLGLKVDTTYRKAKGLMHQKILIIDLSIVMIGSANLTTASLKTHGNLIAGFYSPSLAKYLLKKFTAFSKEGFVETLLHKKFTINNQQLEMWLFPDDQQGVKRIRQLIRSAKKTIKVAMFTWTRFDLTDEIISAQKRGIKTEVVLDRNTSQGVSKKVAQKLLDSGVFLRINHGQGLLHHKFLIVDEKTLLNGSANWTKAAFTGNDDCFFVLHSLDLIQRSFLRDLWREINLESTIYPEFTENR